VVERRGLLILILWNGCSTSSSEGWVPWILVELPRVEVVERRREGEVVAREEEGSRRTVERGDPFQECCSRLEGSLEPPSRCWRA